VIWVDENGVQEGGYLAFSALPPPDLQHFVPKPSPS
jgi:hypothetical protein